MYCHLDLCGLDSWTVIKTSSLGHLPTSTNGKKFSHFATIISFQAETLNFLSRAALDTWTGAQTTLHCALEEGIEHESGMFFENCHSRKSPKMVSLHPDYITLHWQIQGHHQWVPSPNGPDSFFKHKYFSKSGCLGSWYPLQARRPILREILDPQMDYPVCYCGIMNLIWIVTIQLVLQAYDDGLCKALWDVTLRVVPDKYLSL